MNNLSIIIPVYANQTFLIDCINSIKKASFNYNVQIIIGVDGCDQTAKHIKENRERFNGCEVYLFNRNIGCYSVRNNLLRFANSDNIIFFDSDDMMKDIMILMCLSGLKKSDLISFDFLQFENGTNEYINKSDAHGCFACKKSLFEKYGYFESWICAADSEFRYRLDSKGIKPLHIKEPLFFRRMHTKNLTRSHKYGLHSVQRLHYRAIMEQRKRNKDFTTPEVQRVNCKRIL
jgi:glycosyltransferase involved in cell wall biosynthesis